MQSYSVWSLTVKKIEKGYKSLFAEMYYFCYLLVKKSLQACPKREA